MWKKMFMLVPVIVACTAVAADMQPWLVDKAELVFDDSFEEPGLGSWIVKHGEWTTSDGVLSGKELEENHHIASIRHPVEIHDLLVQFDFRFDGCEYLVLLLNEEVHHNFRIVISPSDFFLQKYADGADFASFNLFPAECKADFEPGKWYTMMVECSGDELVARVDDHLFVVAKHPGFDRDKFMLLFPAAGQSASFDNVKVWKGGERLPSWGDRFPELKKIQDARPEIVREGIINTKILESRARTRLLESDRAFKSLLETRVSAQNALRQEYPGTFMEGEEGEAARQVAKKDPQYQALVNKVKQAKKAEAEYLLAEAKSSEAM